MSRDQWLLFLDSQNGKNVNDDADDQYSEVSSDGANDLSMDENAIDRILYPADKSNWPFSVQFLWHFKILMFLRLKLSVLFMHVK